MSDAAEAAVELSEALGGAAVFPIEPGTKGGHYGRSWPKAASANPDTIRKRFAWAERQNAKLGLTGDCNIGIACKQSGLVVVDVDNKHGRDGSATWEKLTDGVTIYTRTHSTPTGGKHVFFHSEDSDNLPNAREWAPGLDLRSGGGEAGGYVLVGEVDGTELGDGFQDGQRYAYGVEVDVPVAAMPGMLAQAIQASQQPPSIDAPGATHYSELVEAFVEMKEGEGRNDTFTAICGHLRNWIPHDDAFRLTAYLVATRANHPLPEDEVIKTIRSIEKATQREAKQLAAGVDLGPVWTTATVDSMFELWDGSTGVIEPEILKRSDGVHAMYRGETHIWFGESGIGKSWVLIEACRQEILKGNTVVYIDQESTGRMMRGRLGAIGLLDYIDSDGASHSGFLTPQEMAEAFGYLRAETGFGVKPNGDIEDSYVLDALYETMALYQPTLLVMDGLTDAFRQEGLSPNDNTEVAALYKGIFEPLAFEFNCGVAAIDHVTKNREMRGDAIGSQHKTSGVTGASYGIHSIPGEPRVGKNQHADLWLSGRKDRPGGAQDSLPVEAGLSLWGVCKMRPEKGCMSMEIDPFEELPEDQLYKRNPWARAAETMCDKLVDLSAFSEGQGVGRTDLIRMGGGGKDAYKREALSRLEQLGVLSVGTQGRRQVVWLTQGKGWRIQHDPKFKPTEETS